MEHLVYWRRHYHRLLERLADRKELKTWEVALLEEFLKRAYPVSEERKAA